MIFGLTEEEWLKRPLRPRWQMVTVWDDVADFEVRRFDHSPREGLLGSLSELSAPNREMSGFRESWFCLVCRCFLLRVDVDLSVPIRSQRVVDKRGSVIVGSGAQLQLFP